MRLLVALATLLPSTALAVCPTPDADLGSATGTVLTGGFLNCQSGGTFGQGGTSGCIAPANEDTYSWTAPASGMWSFTARFPSFDAIASVRSDDCERELRCSDAPASSPVADVSLFAGETVTFVVDSVGGVSGCGSYDVEIQGCTTDTDGDGLSDCQETDVYGTDPGAPDSDGGGIEDGVEVLSGSNPMDTSDDGTDVCVVGTPVLNALPTQLVADTCGRTEQWGWAQGDDVPCFAGANGPDITWAFTAPEDGTYWFDVATPFAGATLHVRDGGDCGETVLSCDWASNSFQTLETAVDLFAGEEVMVVLDGVEDEDCGLFQVDISSCPGFDADADRVCDTVDPCFGEDNVDADADGLCDDEDFLLLPVDMPIGAPFQANAWRAPADTWVWLLVSTRGTGGPLTCVPGTTACTDLFRPVVLGRFRSDAFGNVALPYNVPASVPAGVTVYVQALWFHGPSGTGDVTNVQSAQTYVP